MIRRSLASLRSQTLVVAQRRGDDAVALDRHAQAGGETLGEARTARDAFVGSGEQGRRRRRGLAGKQRDRQRNLLRANVLNQRDLVALGHARVEQHDVVAERALGARPRFRRPGADVQHQLGRCTPDFLLQDVSVSKIGCDVENAHDRDSPRNYH